MYTSVRVCCPYVLTMSAQVSPIYSANRPVNLDELRASPSPATPPSPGTHPLPQPPPLPGAPSPPFSPFYFSPLSCLTSAVLPLSPLHSHSLTHELKTAWQNHDAHTPAAHTRCLSRSLSVSHK